MSQPVRIYDSDGNEIQCTDGKLPVAISSSALPTGAATAANQTTGNNSLSSIDGKLPDQISSRVPVDCHLGEVLSYLLDSIDVAKMSKGAVTTAHNAITATATSAEIDCRGFNSVLLEITMSAAQHWTFGLTGCMTSGGTFMPCYELANTGSFAQMITPEIDSSRIIVFHGIPDYIKVVATEVDDTATVTCKVQPFNS